MADTPRLHPVRDLKGLFAQIYFALDDMLRGRDLRINDLRVQVADLQHRAEKREQTILRLRRQLVRPAQKPHRRATKHK